MMCTAVLPCGLEKGENMLLKPEAQFTQWDGAIFFVCSASMKSDLQYKKGWCFHQPLEHLFQPATHA